MIRTHLNDDHSTLRAIGRSALFLALTGGLLVPYIAVYLLGHERRRAVARLWFRGCCALLGLELRLSGQLLRRRPAVIVANHVSYLDVPVLAAAVDGTFVAKNEVAGWPLFGFLAKLAKTIFVERNGRAIPGQVDALIQRLARGETILFFPEGTSSDGTRVLPFKTALFKIAYPGFPNPQPMVQPVSIAYGDGSDTASSYAWHGDMTLLPHLWEAFARPGTTVRLHFHEPVRPSYFTSRKALARHCEAAVAQGLVPQPTWTALPDTMPETVPDIIPQPALGLREALENA